jgi:hypothetical protein
MTRALIHVSGLMHAVPAPIRIITHVQYTMTANDSFWLPAHVAACFTNEGTVLLDMQRSRYFALGITESLGLCAVVRNWPNPPAILRSGVHHVPSEKTSTSIASELLRSKLLTDRAPPPPSTMPLLDVPATSFGEEFCVDPEIRLTHVAHFLHAYAWARTYQRNKSFFSMRQAVEGLRSTNTEVLTHDQYVRTAELISNFRAIRPYVFSAKENCLLHSLTLIRYLAHYSVFPRWVVGVTLRPWRAHSWVQSGDMVFDSTPEKVCQFTPILAV